MKMALHVVVTQPPGFLSSPAAALVCRTRRCQQRRTASVKTLTRAAAAGDDSPVAAEDLPPAGCERVRLELRKPLGLVLQPNKQGSVFVVEVLPTGSAAKDGRVDVGDELIATSALIYTSESTYGGVAVKGGQKIVRLLCKTETFDTGACMEVVCERKTLFANSF